MATARRVVRTIPQLFIETGDEKLNRLQVAAYARVSTEKEEQEDSFERQVEHYKQLIASKPEWEYVDIYADPGISGTRAEKRKDFMRMIGDCRTGKIQKILVKSISRFARNTVDALNYIRELKDLGISVYFESEKIDTLTPGGEVLLTILAAMAEQESRTISSNIKWAYQRKFQSGDIVLNTGLMLGYRKVDKDEDGHDVYEIVEEEAAIVRRIYREYLAGISTTRIARGLEADGIKTKLGKDKWRYSVIRSILTNEKYTGNALLGKTYKPDVLTKHRQKNDGVKAPIYYVENTHPAIIEKESFDLVKREMERRKGAREDAVGGSKYSSKYPFSGLLICGHCGSKLRRHIRTMGNGTKVPAWGCANKVRNGKSSCNLSHVREDVLEATYLEALRRMLGNASEVTETVRKSVDEAVGIEDATRLDEIDTEILEIQTKVLEVHKAKRQLSIGADEYTAKLIEYSSQIRKLEQERDKLHDKSTSYAEIRSWIRAFEENVTTGSIMTAQDSAVMRSIISTIIVKEYGIELHLKCGVEFWQGFEK